MSEWKEYKLGELVQTNKKSIDSDYPFEEIEYLDTGSITRGKIESFQKYKLSEAPSRAKRLVVQDDIIYSTVRPIQRHYGFIDNPLSNLVVSTGFATITCEKDKLNPKFLYYLLSNDDTVEYLDVIAEASTSAYPSLRPSDIENLEIAIPGLPEQKSIASILSSLDDKIDLLHCQNATLEKIAETLFRQWFVERRPEPVEGEAKEEWRMGKLTDEFDFIMGASPPGESYNEEGIGIPMYQGNADFGFRFPVNRVFTTDPKRFAEKYDTLISVRAPVGEQNMANERCCIGRGVAALRYKFDNSFYTYTYYKIKSLMDEIKQFNETGTVFGSISKSDFENIEIIIPDKISILKFQDIIKPLDDKIITNSIQIRTLAALRDILLPKLMSGEIRVL